MADDSYILTLDLGTTSVRATLFSRAGAVVGRASCTYPLHHPRPGWAEQEPGLLLSAAEETIATVIRETAVLPAQIEALSLSTFFHALIGMSGGGGYLTPAITWADTRAAADAAGLRRSSLSEELYRATGCPPHPMYPFYKFLWLRREEPEVFASSRRWSMVKDLLLWRWTGHWVLDYSVANGTGLWNMQKQTWDEWALELAGLERQCLPDLVPTTTILPLTEQAAARMGLLGGTPVVAGAGDGVLSSLGAGAIIPGILAAMIGTSGALRYASDRPRTDPQGRVWCYHLTEGTWILGGSLNNGGLVWRWFRDQLARELLTGFSEGGPGDWAGPLEGAAGRLEGAQGSDPYERLCQEAARIPPGAEGLLFLPYLAGERSPGFNALARGVLFGLGLNHTRAHLARATLEGIAYRLRDVLEALEDLGGRAAEVRATGGWTRCQHWLQIAADVLDRPLVVPKEEEGSSLGAFYLARLALGRARTLEEQIGAVSLGARLAPRDEISRIYDRYYQLYRRIYEKLQPDFETLATLRDGFQGHFR